MKRLNVIIGYCWLALVLFSANPSAVFAADSSSKAETAKSTTSDHKPSTKRQFKLALPGYKFDFPRDHASHDEFKTEWWYYTGHLDAEDGTRYGYELTFFRSALDADKGVSSGNWGVKNVYMAHFAVSDVGRKKFFYLQRLTRPGVQFAGASEKEYKVFNKDWTAQLKDNNHLLKADSAEYTLDLQLKPSKPLIIHGKNGVSQKANCTGCASHYYSFTHLDTTGTLRVGDKKLRVTGTSWMDHEFGSNQLTQDQIGWDWFSIHLNNNQELMLYVMRLKNGGIDPNSSGTVVSENGSARHLDKSEYTLKSTGSWRSPKSGAVYPMGWSVDVPAMRAQLNIKPVLDDQELAKRASSEVTYWEGACDVTGTVAGKPVSGRAYVEMTGYHEMFDKKI